MKVILLAMLILTSGLSLLFLAVYLVVFVMGNHVTFADDHQQCDKFSFSCNDSTCVPQQLWCDGNPDCPAGEDEEPNCRPKIAIWKDFQRERGVLQCINEMRSSKGFSSVQNIPSFSYPGRAANLCDVANYPKACKCEDDGALSLTCQWTSQGLPNLSKFHLNLTKIEIINLNDTSKSLSPIRQRGQKGYYANINSLLHLTLAKTNLEYIHSYAFNGYNLTVLDLSMNNLGKCEIDLVPNDHIKSNAFYGLNVCTLDMSGSRMIDFRGDVFSRKSAIKWLNLQSNCLTLNEVGMLSNLKETSVLELNNNIITYIENHTFAGLEQLHNLNLSDNPILEIEAGSFDDLISMHTLMLHNTHIKELPEALFSRTGNLTHLELHHNSNLTKLPVNIFRNFNCSFLDLEGLIIENIDEEMFSHLPDTCNLKFEKLLYCFYAHHIRNCSPKNDGISSFDKLLVSPHLVMLAWICAVFTVVCNAAIFCTRWYLDRAVNKAGGVHNVVIRDAKVMSLFIKHLSFSDFLTGIYMIFICIYNEIFKDQYYKHAITWINSIKCKILGVIAMSSAEISMMILTFIALDRFMTIVYFGLVQPKLSIQLIRYILLVIWILGFVIAIIPAILWGDRRHNYYGNNGVCLPLYLQEPHLKGWIYSLAVVIGLNGVLILIIILSYAGIFFWIRKWRTIQISSVESQERELLWRFFILVFLNLCCWIPTFVFKILAVSQYRLPNESYAWIVTFVFPLNSAMNPIVYSLSSSEFRARLAHVSGCHRIYILVIKRLHLLRRRLSAPFTASSSTGEMAHANGAEAMVIPKDALSLIPSRSSSPTLCQRFKDKCRSSLISSTPYALPGINATFNGAPAQLNFRRNESLTQPFSCELVPLKSHTNRRQASF